MTAFIDEPEEPRPSFVVHRRQLCGSEEDTDAKTQNSFSHVLDPESLPYLPVETIAADKIAEI